MELPGTTELHRQQTTPVGPKVRRFFNIIFLSKFRVDLQISYSLVYRFLNVSPEIIAKFSNERKF